MSLLVLLCSLWCRLVIIQWGVIVEDAARKACCLHISADVSAGNTHGNMLGTLAVSLISVIKVKLIRLMSGSLFSSFLSQGVFFHSFFPPSTDRFNYLYAAAMVGNTAVLLHLYNLRNMTLEKEHSGWSRTKEKNKAY